MTSARLDVTEILPFNPAASLNPTLFAVTVWKTETAIQDLIDSIDFYYDPDIDYPDEIHEKQAVLIAASTNNSNLLNYRHQADTLNIYQILKSNGYDDDHIILIIADDITNRLSNKSSEVRVSPNGENLYHDITIDYNLKDISSSDLCDILIGNQSENLKVAANSEKPPGLTGDSETDIFIFWSGHGSNINDDETNGYLSWGGKEKAFADSYNSSLRTYMTNRFTHNFLENYSRDISFKDLYEKTAKATTGSHVQILNTKFYGQLSLEYPAEFFEYDFTN